MYKELLINKEIVDKNGNSYFIDDVEDSNDLEEVIIKLNNGKMYSLYCSHKVGFISFVEKDFDDLISKKIADYDEEKIRRKNDLELAEKQRIEEEKKRLENCINKFRDDYYFLSNFYECNITYNGVTYRNNEAAFQAQKDIKRSEEFANLSPASAKRLGRKVTLRRDWEEVKLDIMYELLKCKFDQNPSLKEKLINTGDRLLVEGNDWHDTYWGVCNGKGSNHLGKLLMKLREEYKK